MGHWDISDAKMQGECGASFHSTMVKANRPVEKEFAISAFVYGPAS
jgi:hypothetical protein